MKYNNTIQTPSKYPSIASYAENSSVLPDQIAVFCTLSPCVVVLTRRMLYAIFAFSFFYFTF